MKRANGSGSLRPKGPGRWELRVNEGPDPAQPGRYRQRSRTFKGTERNARAALRALVAEVEQDRLKATRGTLSFVLDEYMRALERAGRSPNTLLAYRSQIDRYIRPHLGDVPLADLTYGRLSEHYDWMSELGLSANTIRIQNGIISAAITRAQKRGWMGERANPAKLADKPAIPRPKAEPPSAADVLRLIDEADRRNPTLAMLLFVSAMTGCRRGEACALRWRHVDLERGLLTVEGNVWAVGGSWGVKGTKTDRVRRVSLDEATVAALLLHQRRQDEWQVTPDPNPFLFSPSPVGERPYMPQSVTQFFIRLRNDLGLPGVRLHDLRKFMASELLGAGHDVRTVAGRGGWADAKVLLDVYAAFLPVADARAAQTMGALVRPSFLSE